MRITNNMLVNTLLRNVNSNLGRMSTYQDQLATGKKILSPSDDPVGTSKILKYSTDINELAQYKTNTRDALSWMQSSETSLMDINKALQKARDLTVQAANGTLSVEETKKIRQEISQIKEHIITDANTTIAGRYIFSSFKTNEKLLNEDGTFNLNVTDYEINNKPKTTYEVGVGETMDISVNGLDIFGYVEDINYFTTGVPSTTSTDGVESTQTIMKGTFDLTQDYTADTLDVTLDGDVYTVDSSLLNGSIEAIEKKDVIAAYNQANFGGASLEDVANVYFDGDDNLVIKPKAHGAITLSQGSGTFATATTLGSNVTEATITGTSSINDSDIAGDTGKKSLVIDYNGQIKTLEINMSSLNDVADFQSKLQSEINDAFGFTGLPGDPGIQVTAASGSPLSIETINSPNDGTTPEIALRPVKSKKPAMIDSLDRFMEALDTNDNAGIQSFLGEVDDHLQNVMYQVSNIGAKTNRIELINNRIDDTNINMTKLLSAAEDVDMSNAIMKLKNAENVYRASLSMGAKVIQPSLIDFIR